MRHIKQKVETPYIVVFAEEPLEQHLSITTFPDLFEIVDNELPQIVEYLDFQNGN
jgi:hypothetical protein